MVKPVKKTKLLEMVEAVLIDIPDTRNSDISLTIEIWKRYYPEAIKKGNTGKEGVWLADLYHLPREDNVKRLRAKFNAQWLYLPTDPKVMRGRRINEEIWRAKLGYPPLAATL